MKKFKITIDGKAYDVEVEEVREGEPVSRPALSTPQVRPAAPAPVQRRESPAPVAGTGSVSAPMPGTILKVLVNKGDQVEYGQTLLILEAMKMENKINATAAGAVTSIEVNPGQSVDTGQLLLTIE